MQSIDTDTKAFVQIPAIMDILQYSFVLHKMETA